MKKVYLVIAIIFILAAVGLLIWAMYIYDTYPHLHEITRAALALSWKQYTAGLICFAGFFYFMNKFEKR